MSRAQRFAAEKIRDGVADRRDDCSYGIPGPLFGPRTWTTPVSGPRPVVTMSAVGHPS